MAPIDPLQLLKALAPLLSPEGGIKSVDEVSRLSSLMKKFSKKLVSRCVYCNVLKVTKADIVTVFLEEDGWNTINGWINDAKEGDNEPFLHELLWLCRTLPMTVDRLKENNTAKIIKSLTKAENKNTRTLASALVDSWMRLIKGEKLDNNGNKSEKTEKKRKKKDGKASKEEKEHKNFLDTNKNMKHKSENEAPIKPLKIKITRDKEYVLEKDRDSPEPKTKTDDDDDDEFDYLDMKFTQLDEPSPKKPKAERPKTVKTYRTRFRSTGLEEATPLPRDVAKKTPKVDKTAAVAAAKNAMKRQNMTKEFIPIEKKIKPSSLIVPPPELANTGPGIKLIAPKPKPLPHILHESAGFMDALVAAPAAPIRKKKKFPSGQKPPTPTTPPSPPAVAPKLQFYKDTLEMTNEEKPEEKKTESVEAKSEDGAEKPSVDEVAELPSQEESEKPKEEATTELPEEPKEEASKESEQKVPDPPVDPPVEKVPGQLQSILSHGKRRGKKSVHWVEDSQLKEIFYFELDEAERTNGNHIRNFGDLKTLEMRRERQAFETARRLMGDRMEEAIPWTNPLLIDLPPPLIVPGCSSREKEIQSLRQQSTLQEIYFTREMLPDSSHEPDPEMVTPQEPKIIPLEDENNPGSVMDYSMVDLPAPKKGLPPVLSQLMMSITSKGVMSPPHSGAPVDIMSPDINYRPPSDVPPPLVPSMCEPPGMISSGLLGAVPNVPEPPYPMEMDRSEWRHELDTHNLPGNEPPYFPFPPPGMGPAIPVPPMPQMPRPRMFPNHSRGHRMDFGMPRGRGMQNPGRPVGRGGAPRSRGPHNVPCRHFMYMGSCRFGITCLFLHPGVNGPHLN